MLAFAALVLVVAATAHPASAWAVDRWFKIAPSACNQPDYAQSVTEQYYNSGASWAKVTSASSIGIINCPVVLPHGKTVNKIRIRDFQSGGLPANTHIAAALVRVTWNGSVTTLGTALMDTSGWTDDHDSGDFTGETVDNGNYQYFVVVWIVDSGASSRPQLDMIEIRWTE